MEEIELTSAVQTLILRNKGYRFKYTKTGDVYTLITHIKVRILLMEIGMMLFSMLIVSDKSSVVAVKILFLILKL